MGLSGWRAERGPVTAELVEYPSDTGRDTFLKPYVSHWAVTYDDKATSRLQGEQPESFHRDIAEMFPAAAGEYVTHDTLGDSFGGRDAYARVR